MMPARPTSTTTDNPTTALPTGAPPAPTFELSVRQMMASAAAAVTAALLGSRLGVAGTLIGAALASSVTMVAAAVYGHSLATAQYKVKVARGSVHDDHDAPTVRLPFTTQAWGLTPPTAAGPVPVASDLGTVAPRSRMPRPVLAGVGILAACALALLAVTGIEAVRGTPLSGGESGGLSVLGGRSAGGPDTSTTTRSPAASETSSTPAPSETSTSTTPATVTSTVTAVPTDPAATVDPSSSATSPTTASSPSTDPTVFTSGTATATTTAPSTGQPSDTALPTDGPRTTGSP